MGPSVAVRIWVSRVMDWDKNTQRISESAVTAVSVETKSLELPQRRLRQFSFLMMVGTVTPQSC